MKTIKIDDTIIGCFVIWYIDVTIKLFLKVWNKELASIAQRWADQCPGNHGAMHDRENGYSKRKLDGTSVSFFDNNLGVVPTPTDTDVKHLNNSGWSEYWSMVELSIIRTKEEVEPK